MALRKDQHSNYWIDRSFFENDDIVKPVTAQEKREFDIHRIARLAQVRRAVSNFVSILTNRNDIEVRFNIGKDSYTTGNIITISADEDPESFDVTVGLALHEAAHVVLSDFVFLSGLHALTRRWSSTPEFRYNVGTENNPVWNSVVPAGAPRHSFDNIPRISTSELLQYILPPALAQRLVQKSTSDIDEVNRVNVLAFSMIEDILQISNIIEDRRIDQYVYQNVPGYRPYYHAMYDKYFYTKEIGRNLKYNPAWREITVDNYISHLLYVLHPDHNINSMPGLRKVIAAMGLNDLDSLAPWPSSMNKKEPRWYTHLEYATTPELFKRACNVYIEILALTDRAASNPTKIQQSPPMSPEQEPPSRQYSDTGMENLDIGPTGSVPISGAGEEGVSSEDDSDEEQITPTSVEKIVKKGKPATKKSAGTPDTEVDGKFDEKKGEKEKQAAKNIMRGDIKKKKLSKAQAKSVDAAEKADAETVDLTSDLIKRGGECLVIRKVTKNLLSEDWIPFGSHYTPDALKRAIDEGKNMGRVMVHRLQVRNDPIMTKQIRLHSGGVDRRMLANLGMDITNIFQKSRVDIHKPAMLHLSIDASGSMHGPKWNRAIRVAVALAYASSKLRTVDTVISIRSSDRDMPIVGVLFDSRRDLFINFEELIAKVGPNSATPEGLCFQATQKMILECANTHDVYFINFSDGEPSFHLGGRTGNRWEGTDYSGEFAHRHTRTQVQALRDRGVTVLSYFISDSSYTDPTSKSAFTKMYGNDASFVNVESVHEVLKTLNQKLIKRA